MPAIATYFEVICLIINRVVDYNESTMIKNSIMLQHDNSSIIAYLIIMFFVHHGQKIAPVLYIYPSTGTENNTEH